MEPATERRTEEWRHATTAAKIRRPAEAGRRVSGGSRRGHVAPVDSTYLRAGRLRLPGARPWEQWRHYPERQRELGITYVRIAEFAWSRIEPREGEFDWTWLDDAVQALADAGRRS